MHQKLFMLEVLTVYQKYIKTGKAFLLTFTWHNPPTSLWHCIGFALITQHTHIKLLHCHKLLWSTWKIYKLSLMICSCQFWCYFLNFLECCFKQNCENNFQTNTYDDKDFLTTLVKPSLKKLVLKNAWCVYQNCF